jgi:hypothetical protein
MTEPENEIDAQVTDLISKKIAAEDADSGWVVAYAAMRVLPILKDIATQLDVIRWVLGEDTVASSTGYSSPQIAEQLRRIANLFEERSKKQNDERSGRG